MNTIETILNACPIATELRTTLRNLADVDARIVAAERAYAAQVACVTCEVLDMTGVDGKPLYSNDKARDAAVKQAVAESADCAALASDCESLRRERAYLTADAEALRVCSRLMGGAA